MTAADADTTLQTALDTALNPLHCYARIARHLVGLWEAQCAEEGRPVDQLDFADTCAADVVETPARALEMQGLAECFADIQNQGWQFLYYNDLAGVFTGFDAVARRPDGIPVIVEAKATRHPIATTPRRYLRRTRSKGRQLSWTWCWATLTEYACLGASAHLFLALARPMIEGRCARALTVSRCAWRDGHWQTLERRHFDASEITDIDRPPKDFERHRRWMAEIDARCPSEAFPL